MQGMKKRCLYCPNLQVRKVCALIPAPRPAKPVHPPIAELIKVRLFFLGLAQSQPFRPLPP